MCLSEPIGNKHTKRIHLTNEVKQDLKRKKKYDTEKQSGKAEGKYGSTLSLLKPSPRPDMSIQ